MHQSVLAELANTAKVIIAAQRHPVRTLVTRGEKQNDSKQEDCQSPPKEGLHVTCSQRMLIVS